MRFCYALLLVLAALLATTNALSTSEQTRALKITAPNSLTTEEPGAPVKRSIRKRSTTDEDVEERGFSVGSLAKKFGSKLKRLAKYNKWIFTGKKPNEVTDSRYEGYWNFYHNRMTPGGKYNRRLAVKE